MLQVCLREGLPRCYVEWKLELHALKKQTKKIRMFARGTNHLCQTHHSSSDHGTISPRACVQVGPAPEGLGRLITPIHNKNNNNDDNNNNWYYNIML